MSASVFTFPNPVNEVGFLLRVLAGPKLSPLALLASRVIVPRLPWGPRMVAGPPKRFAQAIGLTFSLSAALLFYVFSLDVAAYALLGLLVVAATLESVFGICLGCRAFARLMRASVIPPEVCASCNDIWAGRKRPEMPAGPPTR